MLRIAQGLAIVYILVAFGVIGGNVVAFFQPPPEPVTVSIVYGTEKEDWLEDAAQRFMATAPTARNGAPIQIELEGMGSREQALSIAQGEVMPTVMSPASSIHTELLRDEWAARNAGAAIFLEGANAPEPLVITPLVIVAWDDRAAALDLENHDTLWENLHELVANPEGWAAFGQPEWGLANWGHTNPETSNSGVQTIVLLAYAFYNKTGNLQPGDITNPAFQTWFDEFERAVPEFPSSTGFLMEDMLRFGPSKYDFVVVYENLAIENFAVAPGRGDEIRVYYPPANMLSDHPYAILNAPWVTPEQQEAAAIFRDFLLSEEIQQQALQFGFRPANLSVSLVGADSPFERYQGEGIQTDIDVSLEVPPANVINELIDLWRRGDYE